MNRQRAATAIAATAATLLMTAAASAAPIQGEIVPIREPDGTTVELRVWGDEFYAVGETVDGYTVVRDPVTGLLSYATLSSDGTELVSTGVPAGEPAPTRLVRKHVRVTPEAARVKALAVREEFESAAYGGSFDETQRGRSTSTGDVVGITLIVDFSDDTWSIPPANIDDYCNKPGYSGYGNNGSVWDYFQDVSENLLSYTNFVPDAYYRADETKAYYCNASISYGARARALIVEALEDLDASGFDFSQYDSDGNGIIDAVNCFYAGDTWNAWAEGLWPHCGGLTWVRDGVRTQRYQITNLGSSLRLGTFCHENGHMVMGWPDLYDYGGDSSGVGQFCLMCSAGPGTNPIEPCAWMKYDAGWADVTVLTAPTDGLELPAGTNVMCKFEHPTLANEYYLIENRQRTGRDAGIPDHGAAIWHVDTNGSNNNQQQTPESHYLVTLVQADGDCDRENHVNYGDGSDLYAAPGYTACTPVTYPNTGWWDGSESGCFFQNISSSGPTMTFDFYNAAYALEMETATHATELGFGGTATYATVLKNWAPASDTVTLSIAHDELPDGVGPSDWTAEFREAGGSWQSGPTQFVLGPGEERTFEVRVTDAVGTHAGLAVTTLTADSSLDPQSSTSSSFGTFVEAPSILIVDDDDGASYETYLQTALADTGYSAMTWTTRTGGRPSLERLSSYWAVLWTTGAGDATYLSAADEQNLMTYLDGGGNLLLASAEYLNGRTLPNTFVQDYLHVDAWACDNSGFVVNGITGDPISDGMSLVLIAGPIPPACSDAVYISAPAESILTSPVGVKGIRVEEDGHKLVYLTFPFEDIKTDGAFPDNQKTFVARTLSWFGSTTGVDDDAPVQDVLTLRQNAPNPFNPTTTIAFDVPAGSGPIELVVYNVSGQVVRRLVDGPLEPGLHSVVWNGRDERGRGLASGVYFAKLATGDESVVRKMTLLK